MHQTPKEQFLLVSQERESQCITKEITASKDPPKIVVSSNTYMYSVQIAICCN